MEKKILKGKTAGGTTPRKKKGRGESLLLKAHLGKKTFVSPSLRKWEKGGKGTRPWFVPPMKKIGEWVPGKRGKQFC